MRIILFSIFLFSAINAADASDVVMCQTGTDDGKQVLRYERSVNTPDYSSDQKNLINPDVSALNGVPVKYWKCQNGGVVAMTQAERDDLDLAAATANTAAVKVMAKAAIDDTSIDGYRLQAILEIVMDEINILRAQHGLPARTSTQLRNAVKTKINAK